MLLHKQAARAKVARSSAQPKGLRSASRRQSRRSCSASQRTPPRTGAIHRQAHGAAPCAVLLHAPAARKRSASAATGACCAVTLRAAPCPLRSDIVFDGIGLRWNRTYDNWVVRGTNDPSIAHEVGCIHSTQGYDLSYAYVIIGDDLVYDPSTASLVANKASYFNRNGYATASQEELDQYIKRREGNRCRARSTLVDVRRLTGDRSSSGVYRSICLLRRMP